MSKPLLDVNEISKRFGRQHVLNGVSFQISEGEKIALIGRNGSGKTTLLKIIRGELDPDTGTYQYFDWTRVGTIKQHELLPDNLTTQVFLEKKSGKPKWVVRKQASQFGLHEDHLAQVPAELSGGYQMRVKLTAMFLDDPNLLLLDEPVNYLDLQTLILLEDVLREYRGAFVVVAHDRTFLENTCEQTYEIERAQLTTYNGTVESFLAWKQEQHEFALRTNKKLAKEIRHNQKFVDRFRYKASLASRAQNKLKHINRLRSQIMEVQDTLATTRIAIPCDRAHSGPAVRVDNLAIGYGGTPLAQNIDLEIQRGEKVVIAGENGMGKSTLLKTLTGQLPSLSGKVRWWKHASVGYFDQMTNAALDQQKTVLEHLQDSAKRNASAQQILMMAGNFLFEEDALDKSISVLSGGERARLALAGLLLQRHNVLVLDEPTNHLDVETTDALALGLKDYVGTVLLVSHARSFVAALADRIFEVRRDGVREYMGNYTEYVDYLADLAEADLEASALLNKEDVSREMRREQRARIKEAQRRASRLEKSIDDLEEEKSEILKFFFEHPTDYSPPRAQRLAEVKEGLARLEKEWLQEEEKIQQLRNR